MGARIMNNIEKNDVKKIERRRKFKYGSNAIIVMLSSLIIFVMLNLIASWVTFEVDLTPEKLYSIGDQTKDILENLDKEVKIYGLFDKTKITDESALNKVIELLKKYESYKNVSVEYIDLDKNIEFANSLDPDKVLNISNNNFIVVCGNYKKVIKYYDLFEGFASDYTTYKVIDIGSKAEMALTSAINYVSKDSRTHAVFTIGHEEFTDDYDYIAVGEKLELNGILLDRINLFNQDISDDTDIIIISNPEIDFYDKEITKLKEFMRQGKSIYILMDSIQTNDRFENLQEFLFDYSLQIGYNKIKEYDADYYLEGNQYYLFPELMKVDINKPIEDAFSRLLAPNARSISILKVLNKNLTIQPLLITSDKAKLEGMYKDIEDTTGATYIAAAVHDSYTDSRIILSGTASFMQDQILINYSQYDTEATMFMINNINWLEGDAGEILINQKDYFVNFIKITTKQANVVGGFLVYGLPGLILLAGLIVYLRRRHL